MSHVTTDGAGAEAADRPRAAAPAEPAGTPAPAEPAGTAGPAEPAAPEEPAAPAEPARRSGPPPRGESLARIRALVAELRHRHARPPDAYAWSEHVEEHWWAIGESKRVVRTPEKFGWAVGDYPWEAFVMHGHERFGSEVFVRPTFVDREGRIVPENPTRAAQAGNNLLTEGMCAEIAEALQRVLDRTPEPSAEPPPWPAKGA